MNKTKKTFSLIILAFIISSCNASQPNTSVSPTPSTTVSPIPNTATSPIPSKDDFSKINQELENVTDSNLKSAQNNLNDANIVYANLSGRLLMTNDIDTDAFGLVNTQLLPPMLAAVNSLSIKTASTKEKAELSTKFIETYSDSISQMLKGINLNLTIYQNSLESLQSITASHDSGLTDNAIPSLAKIFQATESVERFVSELGQFSDVIPQEQTLRTLEGIKNQEVILINGIINYTSASTSTSPQYLNNIKQAYFIIAESLTNQNFLTYLSQLAVVVFGAENVAIDKEELTATQPNPNKFLMVIKEEDSVYRFIKFENGQIKNTVQKDIRNLSASDILNETNVVIVSN